MALIIETGSRTIMQMTTPPTGWTKDTSFNEYALRVTTGSVINRTSGHAFTTVFKTYNDLTCTGPVTFTVNSTTIDNTFNPTHVHFVRTGATFANRRTNPTPVNPQGAGNNQAGTSDSTGLSTGHNHPNGTLALASPSALNQSGSPVSINLNLKYVDVIIAVRS